MSGIKNRVLAVDAEQCTGCGLCELACSLQHEGICSPDLSRIRVLRREELGLSLPVVCRQCTGAPCATTCPVQAIRPDPSTGAWLVDAEICIGCRECLAACPFGALYFSLHVAESRVLKCDLCGGEPRCVLFCGTGALSWVQPSRLGEARRQKAMARYQARQEPGRQQIARDGGDAA